MMHAMHGRVPSSRERRLGVCVYANSGFAKIVPEFVLSGDRWVSVVNAEIEYPPDGKVFCPGSEMMNPKVGDVWEFSVKPNDRPESDHGHHRTVRRLDEVVAYDIHRAKQVIDLSDKATVEEARQRLVELGVDQPLRAGEPVFVKFEGDLWAQMEMEKIEGVWKPALKVDLENVPLRKTSAAAPITKSDIGQFLPSSFFLESEVRTVDLTTDAMFAKALPRRLRQILGDGPVDDHDALSGTTDRERVQIYMRAAEIAPSRHEHLVAFNERLRAFSVQLDRNSDLVEEVFRSLRDQPAVARRIRREAERLAEEARAAIRRDVEAEVAANWERDNAALVEAKRKLTSELTALEDRNRGAIGRLAETKKNAKAIERGIAEVVDGLRVVLERAPKRSSERARLIADHVEKLLVGGKNVLMPSELPPWSSDGRIDAKEIGLDDLAGSIRAASTSFGLEGSDVEAFDVLLRAGEAVLLAGSDREAFLTAYVSAVTGGTLRRMPLDFGIIGADDLWRQPGTGGPTAFAHAWVAARARPDIPILIVLDEIQATCGWGWIGPLKAYLASEWRPANLLICMTADAPRPDDAEAFRRAVDGLCRMAPMAKDAAAFRAARRHASAGPSETKVLIGIGETPIPALDELDGVVADLADATSSVRHAARAVDVMKSALAAMPLDRAAAVAADFLAFLTGEPQETGAFARLSDRFDEACAISRPQAPGGSDA